jgi:hypothetical protein
MERNGSADGLDILSLRPAERVDAMISLTSLSQSGRSIPHRRLGFSGNHL